MLVNKHPKHTRARQARPTLALLPGWNRVLTRTRQQADSRASSTPTYPRSDRPPLTIRPPSNAPDTEPRATASGFPRVLNTPPSPPDPPPPPTPPPPHPNP